MDENVKLVLVEARATVYLPIFAKKMVSLEAIVTGGQQFLEQVSTLFFCCWREIELLVQIGVSDEGVRCRVLEAAQRANNKKKRATFDQPAAATCHEPAAALKTHFEMQCVICMDLKVGN